MYVIFTWPFVRAEDPEVVAFEVEVETTESGRHVYPFASFPFAATLIVTEEGEVLRNSIQGLGEVTDREGLLDYIKQIYKAFDESKTHEWVKALTPGAVNEKIVAVYGSTEAYRQQKLNKNHMLFDSLVPFFKSRPVKPFFRHAGPSSMLSDINFKAAQTGRFSATEANSSAEPQTVNDNCPDC